MTFNLVWKLKKTENAVINSNHAIIILSVGYLRSRWCQQELFNCHIEHLTDPSFKLFFILTEAKDYILPFLRDHVYAELFKKIKNESLNYNDPQLWEKLFRKISIGSDDDDDDDDDANSDDYQTLEYEKINPRASWVR